MNAPAVTPGAQALGEATIVRAEIDAAHDGEAELVVSLRYANGALGTVTLDADTAFNLMHNCGVEHADDLAGHSWRKILEGL